VSESLDDACDKSPASNRAAQAPRGKRITAYRVEPHAQPSRGEPPFVRRPAASAAVRSTARSGSGVFTVRTCGCPVEQSPTSTVTGNDGAGNTSEPTPRSHRQRTEKFKDLAYQLRQEAEEQARREGRELGAAVARTLAA
jgi:hypothetical protein